MIAVIVSCGARAGGVAIVLSNRFISANANRATIDTTVDIAYAAQRPHSNATNGDEHAAGTSKKIGLATVVEIMNAREPDERDAVADLEEAGNKTVSIAGFWRLWPGHAVAADFLQSGEADENHEHQSTARLRDPPGLNDRRDRGRARAATDRRLSRQQRRRRVCAP